MEKTGTCCNCGATIDLSQPGWCEVDDGDLCPECAKELDFDPQLDD